MTAATATKPTVPAARKAASKPRVSRKATVKAVTLIIGTRKPNVTVDSRALLHKTHNVKLPKGTTGDRAVEILTAAGFKVELVTWSKASKELRAAAAAAAGKDDDGDDGEE